MKRIAPFTFDKVHRPCCCVKCVAARLARLMRDLDAEYGPGHEFEAATEKETVN